MPTNFAYLLGVTLIIHVIDTLAYAVRLNSVKSKRFALSVTLFNLFYLISLLAHTLQSPLIGSLIDSSLSLSLDPLPQLRQIIVAASAGIFNTLANIVFMLFIDPKSSIITDQALRGNRPYADVKALVIILMSAKLLGTLLGQLLLLPLARAIAAFYG
ncbi:MAG: DUF2837 family protein [Peptococcaceae bacterium]|nr:DUF2837 family protein [Peptococcaceae bacterium]